MAHVIARNLRWHHWHTLVRAWVTVMVMAFPIAGLAAPADDDAIAERRVKAAYLYRFAGYVEWPDGAFAKVDSPMTIGVWGNDDLADDLARLVAERTVDGRRFEVSKVKDVEGLTGLRMLFINKDRGGSRLLEMLGSGAARGMLIVTESPGAFKLGGAINFVNVDGQIRFELSLEAAEKRGLKLSSRLVAVSQNLSGKVR